MALGSSDILLQSQPYQIAEIPQEMARKYQRQARWDEDSEVGPVVESADMDTSCFERESPGAAEDGESKGSGAEMPEDAGGSGWICPKSCEIS